MNSRNNSDNHDLSSSSRRVSAHSRFSPPPPPAAAFASPSANSATSVAKSGINGRSYEEDDELSLGGGSALSASRNARRDAAKRSTSASSQLSAATAGSTSSVKERPWRTTSSSSTATTANTTNSNYNTTTSNSSDYNLETRTRSNDSTSNDSATKSTTSTKSVTTPTRNRWAQYETDDLADESRRATNNAVVDMATRIANETEEHVDMAAHLAEEQEEEQPMEQESLVEKQPIMGGDAGSGYGNDGEGVEVLSSRMPAESLNSSTSRSTKDYVKSRLSSLVTQRNSNHFEHSQSDHDKVRSEALKMLQMADTCLQDSPRNASNSNSPQNSTNDHSGTTGLFRTAGGGIAMRELHTDELSSVSIKREKASSIAGIDNFSSNEKPTRYYDGVFAIDSRDENDLKKLSKNSNGEPISPNSDTPSSWSSRYSVERQLMAITGGLDSTHMLAKMDRLHTSRQKTKSARGLYRASGYALDGSHEEADHAYTSNSTGRFPGGNVWLWLKGTLWSDELELNSDGTTQSLVRREVAMRKRRRLRYGLVFLVGLCITIGVLVHVGNPTSKKAMVMSSSKDVHFYVLADEPYDFSNVELLTRELESLPADAEFVIHLGNANSDEQSRCQEYGFERAAAILKESPVPVLVIPGDLDWAACGSKEDAEQALNWWDVSLGRTLERKWEGSSPLDVDYFDAVVGNFSFLHKGVLFISVNIVDAETEPTEVTRRLEQNVMWTKEKLTQFNADEYHALVILGHAPPSSKQGEYFWPVVEQIKDIQKPVLYLHANSNGSFEQYTPFSDAENFRAVQLEKRGVEAPMRVVVMAQDEEGGGNDYDGTFMFERREPPNERTAE